MSIVFWIFIYCLASDRCPAREGLLRRFHQDLMKYISNWLYLNVLIHLICFNLLIFIHLFRKCHGGCTPHSLELPDSTQTQMRDEYRQITQLLLSLKNTLVQIHERIPIWKCAHYPRTHSQSHKDRTTAQQMRGRDIIASPCSFYCSTDLTCTPGPASTYVRLAVNRGCDRTR